MKGDNLTMTFTDKIRGRIDAIASRVSLPPAAVYAAIAVALLAALSLAVGLASTPRGQRAPARRQPAPISLTAAAPVAPQTSAPPAAVAPVPQPTAALDAPYPIAAAMKRGTLAREIYAIQGAGGDQVPVQLQSDTPARVSWACDSRGADAAIRAASNATALRLRCEGYVRVPAAGQHALALECLSRRSGGITDTAIAVDDGFPVHEKPVWLSREVTGLQQVPLSPGFHKIAVSLVMTDPSAMCQILVRDPGWPALRQVTPYLAVAKSSGGQ